jgi:hypothetical protein
MDFRKGKSVSKVAKLPEWTDVLYSQIKTQFASLPLGESK